MQEKDRGDRLVGQPIVQTNRKRKSPYNFVSFIKHEIISCGSHAVMAMKK